MLLYSLRPRFARVRQGFRPGQDEPSDAEMPDPRAMRGYLRRAAVLLPPLPSLDPVTIR